MGTSRVYTLLRYLARRGEHPFHSLRDCSRRAYERPPLVVGIATAGHLDVPWIPRTGAPLRAHVMPPVCPRPVGILVQAGHLMADGDRPGVEPTCRSGVVKFRAPKGSRCLAVASLGDINLTHACLGCQVPWLTSSSLAHRSHICRCTASGSRMLRSCRIRSCCSPACSQRRLWCRREFGCASSLDLDSFTG